MVNYSYLSDGTKLSALDGNGEGLVYRGPFVYRKGAGNGNSSLTLESAAFGGGRLTPTGAMLYVTDYLGSVRAVVDGANGAIYKASDYSTYGSESKIASMQTASISPIITLRDGYTCKEDQNANFNTGYTDFGARQYNPALRRWMTPDPLSEKYYSISPYAFCNNNPVNLVDLDGKDIWEVDTSGKITKVKETTRTIIKTVNEDGKVLGRLWLGKSDISSDVVSYQGKEYCYFTASNDKIAKKIFEFVALPSNWGFINRENNAENINECSVLYTNKGNAILMGEKKRVATRLLAVKFSNKGAIFSQIAHVHPNNDPEPSGIDDNNGDIPEIQRMYDQGIVFSTPEEYQFSIFTPKNRKYHYYDRSYIPMIEPSIVKAKVKR